MKSYLIDHGYQSKVLSGRNFGHDIGSLLRESVQNGLMVSYQDANSLLLTRKSHCKHFMRYGPLDFEKASTHGIAIQLFDEIAVIAVSARLIDTVSGDPLKLRKIHGSNDSLEWEPTNLKIVGISKTLLLCLMSKIEIEALRVEKITEPK